MDHTSPKKVIKKNSKPAAKRAASDLPKILQFGDPVLHKKAKEISIDDIASKKVQKTIEDMKKVLASQDDGIGLAAPQIGISLRIFVVSGKALLPPDDRLLATEGKTPKRPIPNDLVFINPVIVKESAEKKWMEGEGCLSVRWLYGKVKRATKVTVRAYNEKGQIFERGAAGIMSHIFQHEIDHLDGILFIDKAKDVEHLEQDSSGKTHGHSRP